MGKIEKILKKGPVEGQTTEVYPVTSTKAVYDENNKRLDTIITGLQESVYLNNTPIPISTENTPEANAQNVKNIADYVEKAKAAGIADVNGMGVTCIIDGDNSAVGYLYGEDIFVGILLYDDNSLYYVLISNGSYIESRVVIEEATSQVTSNMLVQGARNPIILTPDTTEVDEETYQKLLSDDVDVVFITTNGEYCALTYIEATVSSKTFYFNCLSAEDGNTMGDIYIYAYEVDIVKTKPHTCTITPLQEGQTLDGLIETQFIHKSFLSPVLQEIDLTGTDEERKAKLVKFEADWKALTGASDLSGARFVGYYETPSEGVGIFSYNAPNGTYSSILTDSNLRSYQVFVEFTGIITITPLFSHLEAITLKAGNTNEDMAANVATIKAYIDNLKALGVDTTKGFMVSVNVNILSDSGYYGYMASHYVQGSYFLSGTIFKTYAGEYHVKNITINPTGRYDEIVSTTS